MIMNFFSRPNPICLAPLPTPFLSFSDNRYLSGLRSDLHGLTVKEMKNTKNKERNERNTMEHRNKWG